MLKHSGHLSLQPSSPIAILAGEGKMPQKLLRELKALGHSVLILAIHKVTSPVLVKEADAALWLHVTQLGKAIRFCNKHHVQELVMAGRVHHRHVLGLSLWKLDWTAIKVWWKLEDKRADSLLKGICQAFLKADITVVNSVKYLKKFLAPVGVLTKKQPSKKQLEEIPFGIKLAQELGRLDVGQTVVIKNKTIVAVEAMEGTDLCLERAGQIAGPGCIVVKMPKPAQDMRFDVPVVGVNTIEKMAKIQAPLLVIEAERSLLIDEETIAVADHYGICILSCPSS